MHANQSWSGSNSNNNNDNNSNSNSSNNKTLPLASAWLPSLLASTATPSSSALFFFVFSFIHSFLSSTSHFYRTSIAPLPSLSRRLPYHVVSFFPAPTVFPVRVCTSPHGAHVEVVAWLCSRFWMAFFARCRCGRC
uniref:Uncharacterized protein n=1 Tax=Physcomitrium patens TaxID=3218 RepID=A0A7I3ZJB0_PHYPA